MTSQELTVGDVPVRALQVTFVGEHGWELYAPSEYGARLWSEVWAAGGRARAGRRRLPRDREHAAGEGLPGLGHDLTAETTPYEAGLGFCVKLDKAGGFAGRDALVAAKERGLTRKLCAIVLDDPRAVVLGSEPVRVGGRVSGRVTSAGYGYTVGASIAYAYLADRATPARHARCTIDLFGDRVAGRGRRRSRCSTGKAGAASMDRRRDLGRPRIGLTTYREPAAFGVWDEPADLLPATYADAISAAGGVPMLLPPARADRSTERPRSVLDGLARAGAQPAARTSTRSRYGATATASDRAGRGRTATSGRSR